MKVMSVIQLRIEHANVIRKALRNYLEDIQARDSALDPDDSAAHVEHHDNQKEFDLITKALSYL